MITNKDLLPYFKSRNFTRKSFKDFREDLHLHLRPDEIRSLYKSSIKKKIRFMVFSNTYIEGTQTSWISTDGDRSPVSHLSF
jgi:hypothetical protein